MAGTSDPIRKSGIDILGDAPWGTHFCQFYHTKEDLLDILVPYFKAGLENNEFCMWVTSDPLGVEDAKEALKKEVENLDKYIKKGQIEIIDFSQWYTRTGKFEADKVLQGWVDKEQQALKNGFEGLRLTGNISWIDKKDWKSFSDYEATVNNVIHKYKILAICSYSLDKCAAPEILDVISTHQFAVIKQDGKWTIIESTERKKAEEALRESEEIFRSLMEHSPVYVFFKDENIRALKLSRNYETMLGRPIAELLGKNMDDLFPSELAKSMVADDMRVLKEGKEVNVEEELNGRFYSTIKFPIKIEGKPRYLAGVTTDITERKRTEDALKQSQEQLMISERLASLGRIAAGVAHELNNPLTGVLGMAQLMLEETKRTTPNGRNSRLLRKALCAASRSSRAC